MLMQDTYWHNDNRRAKNMYLWLYCKGSKRVTQGLRVRGSWRPNRTAICWPQLLWPSTLCLSHSPGLLNWRPRGPALCWIMAFFTAPYQQLLWTPTQSGGSSPIDLVWLSLPHLVSNSNSSGALRAASAWCGFPYHSRLLLQL